MKTTVSMIAAAAVLFAVACKPKDSNNDGAAALALAGGVAGGGSSAGCTVTDATATWASISATVAAGCGGASCHTGGVNGGFDSASKASAQGKVVAGNSGQSKLWNTFQPGGKMAGKGYSTTSTGVPEIKNWIDKGCAQ